MTFMPRLAYLYKFREGGLACAPIEGTQEILHCLMYRADPSGPNFDLLQTFTRFVRVQLQRRFRIRCAT